MNSARWCWLGLLAALSFPATAEEGENAAPAVKLKTPLPFEASYDATYQGTRFSDAAVRRLERLPNGLYRISFAADHLFYSLHQESVLEFNGCQVRPQHFHEERGNLFGKRRKDIDFHWDTLLANYDKDGEKGQFKLQPGAVDPISAHIPMACQALAGKAIVTLPETDDDHIEPQEYRLLGEEVLPVGDTKVRTYQMELVHRNKTRKTYFWIMADNPALTVKAWQKDKDGVYVLELTRWKPLSAK